MTTGKWGVEEEEEEEEEDVVVGSIRAIELSKWRLATSKKLVRVPTTPHKKKVR